MFDCGILCWIIIFTPSILFQSVFYLQVWANLVQALVNLFPRVVSLLFNGLFVQNILYLFHTRSTAEGFLYFRELAAAVEGGLQRKDWRRFHTVSHRRIATRLLYLFYLLSFIHLFIRLLLPSFCTMFSPFLFHSSFSHSFYDMLWAQITATDIICNVKFFSLSHNGKSWECSARHFYKCQCFSAIVRRSQRHKMSASLLSHSLCELLTSGNVNEQTTMGGNRFLKGGKHSNLQSTLEIDCWV